MAEPVGIKDRLQELIGNIQQCSTEGGLSELEQLYKQKQKEHKNDITPMMDIMVRDAIEGRRGAFASERQEVTEQRYTQFKRTPIEIDEGCSTAVYYYDEMFPVTHSNVVLGEQVQSVIDRLEAAPMVFISDCTSPYKPLEYSQRKNIYESAEGTLDFMESKGSHLANINEMLRKGIVNIYACANSKRLDEMREVGKYFLKHGGQSFRIIELNDYLSESTPTEPRSLHQLVVNEEYEAYSEIVHLPEKAAKLQYKYLGEIL